MKKRIVILLMMMIAAAFAACSGDDGAVGPAGPSGVPQPIKVLLLGSDGGVATKAIRLVSALPAGSSLNYINTFDSIPPISLLKSYNACIVYNNSTPLDRDGLSDRLADYVDQGGKLVLLQTCMTTSWGFTGGRLTDPAYMPYVTTAPSNNSTELSIDQSTITFPVHPIFVGVDIPGYRRTTLGSPSYPTLQTGATSLCQFTGAVAGVAINPNGRIIGINDYPYVDGQELYNLTANCCLFLAGRIK